MLARVLDDEAAQEAQWADGARARSCASSRSSRGLRRGVAERVGHRRALPDAPHRAAVDDERDEDQRLLLRRVVDPAVDGGPATRRASARTAAWRRSRPADRREPAGREPLHDARGQAHAALAELGVLVVVVPDERAVDVRRRHGLAAARGCRARSRRTAPAARRARRRQLEQPARQPRRSTTDWIAEMSVAATRASCSATTAGRSPAAAAATARPGSSRARSPSADGTSCA